MLFFVVQFIFLVNCFAQKETIDSLKRVLPLLRNSARVDCLNSLGGAYLELNNDTAAYYAALAYTEAVKINYIHGIAESLSYKGEIEDLSDNFPAGEKLSREAINWYKKTPNKKRLADTYLKLGYSMYAQSFFTESIKNFDTGYEWFKKNDDALGMNWALLLAGLAYDECGNYEKAFEFERKSLAMAIQNNNDALRRGQLAHIAELFRRVEDFKTALEYYRQAFQNLTPDTIFNNSDFDISQVLSFTELFSLQHQFDSAKYYYGFADTSNQRVLRFYLVSAGENYFLQKQYGEALPNLLRGLYYHKQSNDRNQVMRTLLDIAKTYSALGNNDSAFINAIESLNIATQTGARQFIRDACEILSSTYDHWHQTDSAYFYYRKYVSEKDLIAADILKGKFAAYNYEQKIALLDKEKLLQKQKINKAALERNLLLAGIAAIIIVGIILLRNITLKRKNESHLRKIAENELQLEKLESERTKAELHQQATELEIQILRAQMNPHFIFNSLNSINLFILQNNKHLASEYLSKFSRLIRLILQNSQAALIPLESELETLQLYLELEALRFDHHFNYKINVDEDIDTTLLKVPPLIIQPYAENAIWHGLMLKEEKGHLEIWLLEEDDVLLCKITDDGIGRKKAKELKSKSASAHKSMGMRITAERIAMVQQKKQLDTYITINDLILADGSAAGTEVTLKIPVHYD
jgi:tetratricopeptide (TPR) repeat protein